MPTPSGELEGEVFDIPYSTATRIGCLKPSIRMPRIHSLRANGNCCGTLGIAVLVQLALWWTGGEQAVKENKTMPKRRFEQRRSDGEAERTEAEAEGSVRAISRN